MYNLPLKTFDMKNLYFLLILLSCFSSVGYSQFSESFFELLSPSPPIQKPNAHFFGIKTQDGALAIRLADSLDTEVQWVKAELNGNYQMFSAHLPGNDVSPNECIIQVFEVGNKQYIVTNDSLSYAPRGIRIHKFENYTENAGYYEYPTNFRWKNNQAYFHNGKIYIFFINSSNELKRLIINPETMVLENELLLANYPFSSNASFNQSIHVHFISTTKMDVYIGTTTQLARIQVTDHIASPLELHEMQLKKVIGIDPYNNRLICLKTSLEYDLQRYQLNPDIPLSGIQVVDSLDLPRHTTNSLKNWMYVTDGTIEFIHSLQGKSHYLTLVGNQIITHDSTNLGLYVSNIDLINGKPISFGMRSGYFVYNHPNTSTKFLFISYGETSQLYKFKEYYGIYSFGDFNTRFGTGNSLIPPIETSAFGDFIFSRMIFNLSQVFVGTTNNTIKGYFSNAYQQYYKPGPYTQSSQYSQEVSDRYNENLYVDLYMVNQHVASVGNPNYVIPKAIANWPAHGDASKGQAANLAPFMDLNNNGTYEPVLGEYPVFPGSRCLLNISHQHEEDHNGIGSGLELHTYMYKFDCGDSIEDVIFVRTEVFNRGNIHYDSLSSGLIADFDLGGPMDDYIGTHVDNGLIYAYNGDHFDDDFSGVPGFGDSLATVGVLFLKGSKFPDNNLDDSRGIGSYQTVNGMGFNDGIVDNEYKGMEYSFYHMQGGGGSQSDASNAIEWNNFLNGKSRLGDTLFYGGTQIPSKYIFPDNTDPLFYGTSGIDPAFYWSESQLTPTGNGNPPGDRRIGGSFGPAPLPSGNKITYHSAVLSGKRFPGAGQSQIDLFAKAKHVRNAFDNNLTSCGQTFGNTTQEWVTSLTEIAKELEVKVYPNPFTEEIFIAVSFLDEHTQLQMFDINGKVILSEKVTSGKHIIQTNSIENGIYFLRVENGNGTTTKKIVKQ